MKTPQGRRLPRDQRRQQLLAAAAANFSETGYHATSMDDIAESAGVSKPVLYQHFPSKLLLYTALVDVACERLVEMVTDALRVEAAENEQRVRATLAAFYRFVTESDDSFRFVFESDLTADADVQERIWQAQQDLAHAIGQVISEDTDLPEHEATFLGIALVGMAQVSARHWHRTQDEQGQITAARAAELIAVLGWRGIAGFPLAHPGDNTP